MDEGIIYIARNKENPPNHFNIGISKIVDPDLIIKKLNNSYLNYKGKFYCKGYVIIEDLNWCKQTIHKHFKNERISPNKEFFDIRLEKIILDIRELLNNKIIKDNFPLMENEKLHLIELVTDLKKLDFFEVTKIANNQYVNNVDGFDGSFHGIPASPLFYFWDLIIKKKEILLKTKKNLVDDYPIFFHRKDLSVVEKSILEQTILKTNLENYFKEIPYNRNLLYLGNIFYYISGREKNKLLSDFIVKNVNHLFSNTKNFKKVIDALERYEMTGFTYLDLIELCPLFEQN